jgi:hypothetical protein
MARPADWNSSSTKFGMILRDFETCSRLNAAVGLGRRGQTIEVWVRDCTPPELGGDWDALVPNATFTTGPYDAPAPPAGPIRDGMPGDGSMSLQTRAQLVIDGQVGSSVFEAWKLARCTAAIAQHAAARG